MAIGDVLAGIQDPVIADVPGAFKRGQQTKRQELSRELVGQILGSTKAGRLGALAKADPQVALVFADKMGFFKSPMEQAQEFIGTVQFANATAKSGATKEANAILVEYRNRQAAMGLPTDKIDGMIQSFDQDPAQGAEALGLMNDAFVEQGLAKAPGADVEVSPKTVILEDGSTIQTTSRGKVIVRNPAGKKVTGDAAEEVVAKSNKEGVRLETARAGGAAGAAAEEKRAFTLIDRGTLAAESTAVIRRALTLLDTVKTGGVAAISLAAKQSLGIEGADEGELSNSLGKAVLSQLRETFGAQFTESEGKRLERIEAGFSKSPANNRRLLTQTLGIAERIADRARRVAKKRGLTDVVQDIDDLLSFSLDPEEEKKPAASRFQIEVIE